MTVLLINGSPHEKGCTYIALKEVADELNRNGIDTDLLWLGSGPIADCLACGKCRESGHCQINDNVITAQSKLIEYDGLVVGSPVYYAGPAGRLTCFLDRLFYSSGKKFAGKPAACITSARRAGTTCALDRMTKYFTISEMPVVSSSYWNMVHGNTPEEAIKDEEGLQTMRNLGRNMAWLIKSLKECGPKPESDCGNRTSFIR